MKTDETPLDSPDSISGETVPVFHYTQEAEDLLFKTNGRENLNVTTKISNETFQKRMDDW